MHKSSTLRSFDSTQQLAVELVRPETHRHLLDAIASEKVAIARGAGLSYSAASFGAGAVSIDLTRFDRILAYDESSGIVEVEPGLRIGALARFLAQRGRYLPAMPGYPSITIGGCIAFDIHGKSQFHSGNFGDWVESLELHHRDHGCLGCSREQNADVLALTVGGAGLTGVVTRARLRTLPLPGRSVEIESVPVRNLLESADVLRARAEGAASLYSWNNLNRRGDDFGSGIVYVERFVDSLPERRASRAKLDLLARFPLSVWTRASVPIVLSAYETLQKMTRLSRLSHEDALFPIYGKEYYYTAFGHRGFRECQMIVPFECWPSFVASLEQVLNRSAVPVTLGSLKLFRGAAKFLRFSGSGICLALDVPASARSAALFEQLDALAIRSAAIVNLSKDSRLSADTCQRVFPDYAQFREALRRFDPEQRYSSHLRAQTGV